METVRQVRLNNGRVAELIDRGARKLGYQSVMVNGKAHSIPTYWLMGCAHTRGLEGLPPMDAYQAAIMDWVRQDEMAADFAAGK